MDNDEKIKKSLKASFLDGIFASCMVGLTADYITPYALALKATVGQIGFLNSLPNLVASLFQLKSADVTEKLGSRKRIINLCVFLHALSWLPIILIPFLFKENRAIVLVLFVTLYASLGGFAVPAWSSLMSDHIPQERRGEYFGWRSKILGFISVVFAFLAGFILNWFKKDVFVGFLIIFSAAMSCRFISWYFLTRMYEPPLLVPKEAYFNFLDFLRRIRESNFAKFVIFVALLNFSVYLASPFFAVFMLRDLKFNYLVYILVVTTATCASLLTINKWGRHADKIGNVKILKLTSTLIALIPLFWIPYQHPLYLILVQVFSGFVWAGFNLCASNFIYDAVSPAKRTRCISYFNVLNGVALCSGALLGSYLANRLPHLLGYRILSLFLISTILRLTVALIFSRRIKEVRPVEKVRSINLFYSVIGLRPLLGITRDTIQTTRRESQ